MCLLGVSSPSIVSLANDSNEVKYQKIADKPFKNHLVVGLILFGPGSRICSSEVVSLGTKLK